MKKEFIHYDLMRDNTIKIMDKIYSQDKFYPDIMYVCLRGGSYIGNIISEFFKSLHKEKKVIYAALIPRSYNEIGKREQIIIDGWTHHPNTLNKDSKVMIVDDIYDSGFTVNVVCDEIMKIGIPRQNIKIIVHEYKNRIHLGKDLLPIKPDYYCRKIDIANPETDDIWLHYLSHELIGLTKDEIKEYYGYDKDVCNILLNFKG